MPGKRIKKVGRGLRRYFFAGLVVLIPLIVTWQILLTLFHVADGFLGQFLNRYLQQTYGQTIPGLGLLLTVVLVFGVGALVSSNIVGRRLIQWAERSFARLPLVRHIYPSVRQIAEFFFAKDHRVAFRKVVLVEYPSPGIWSIGFVTNEEPEAVSVTAGQRMYAILIPTPPSPLSGPIIFLPEKQVTLLDITVEEGLKLAMSGGVLVPKLHHKEHHGSP